MKMCSLFLTVLLSATGLACGNDVVDPNLDPFDEEGYFVHVQYEEDEALTMIEPFFIARFSAANDVILTLSANEDRPTGDPDDSYRMHEINITMNRQDLEGFEFPLRFTIDGTSIFTSSGASVHRAEPDASPTISGALFTKRCLCFGQPQPGQQTMTGFLEITEYNMPRVTGIIDIQVDGQIHGDRDWGVNQLRLRARYDTALSLSPPRE